MESGTMIIKNDNEKNLHITLKGGFSAEDLYSALIIQMEWSQARHNIDAQRVMDWIKEKNFFTEHINNPVV